MVKLGGQTLLQVVCSGDKKAALRGLPEVEGLTMQAGQPSISTSIMTVGGVTRREASTSWLIQARPLESGRYRIPPLEVEVDGKLLKTKSVSFECIEDLRGRALSFLELGSIPELAYVHQPIDIWIRVGIDTGIVDRLQNNDSRNGRVGLLLTVPWLAEFPGGVKIETEPDPKRAVQIVLNGQWETATFLGRKKRADKEFFIVELRRRFLPNRPGKYPLNPVFLEFTQVTRYRRDFFGGLEPAEVEEGFGRSEGLSITILPVPEEGRPPGFHNAVGRFALHGELSKRELKAGEPIRFELRIEGRGNFEFLEVPELDDLVGFHVFGKKVERKRDQVLVKYDLAALDGSVERMPEVGLSYFDPTAEPPSYDRAATEAIPIRVEGSATAGALEPLPETGGRTSTPGVDDIWDFMAIDGPRPVPFRPEPWMVFLALAAPLGLVLVWFAFLRRILFFREHPDALRARRAAQRFRRVLRENGSLRSFSLYLADRMGWDEGAAVRQDLGQLLVEAGVTEALAKRCNGLMHELLASRYGGENREQDLSGEVERVVGYVERELGR